MLHTWLLCRFIMNKHSMTQVQFLLKVFLTFIALKTHGSVSICALCGCWIMNCYLVDVVFGSLLGVAFSLWSRTLFLLPNFLYEACLLDSLF